MSEKGYELSSKFSKSSSKKMCAEVLPETSSAFLAGRKVFSPNLHLFLLHQRSETSNRIGPKRLTTHFCRHGHPNWFSRAAFLGPRAHLSIWKHPSPVWRSPRSALKKKPEMITPHDVFFGVSIDSVNI